MISGWSGGGASNTGAVDIYGGRFPSPWLDMASLAMPRNHRNALQWCLPPGYLIELENGQYKNNEDISIGDRVLTRGGTTERVCRVSSRHYSGELVSLVYAGFGVNWPFRMTPEHQVYRIKAPNKRPSKLKLNSADAERVTAAEVRPGDWVATPLPRRDQLVEARAPGYLLGAYLAEGFKIASSAGVCGVKFTCGTDDLSLGYIGKIQQLLENHFDLAVDYVLPKHNSGSVWLSAYDSELAEWAISLGGTHAKGKKIGAEVFSWSESEILDLLAGWIDGDGWVSSGQAMGHTASKSLAWSLLRLANICGLTPGLCYRVRDAERGKDRTAGFQLHFGKQDTAVFLDRCLKLQRAVGKDPHYLEFSQVKRRKVFVQDGYVFRKVLSVSAEDYSGAVHNFEVENDHSYIADGVLTSNCEFIFDSDGSYRSAQERIISYFLTDIEINSMDKEKALPDEEKDRWDSILGKTIGIRDTIHAMNMDLACYGNAFASLVVPFRRFLASPFAPGLMFAFGDMASAPSTFNLKYDSAQNQFVATCPKTGKRGAWKVVDLPDDLEQSLKVKLWPAQQIEIICDPWTGDCSYVWRIPEDYKRAVRSGTMHILERAPTVVLEAISKNAWFMFEPDSLFHMKEPTLSGRRTYGWGISRVLINYRDIWHVQVLRRFNEAIALDYVIPFRVITPQTRSTSSGIGSGAQADPLLGFNLGQFRGQIEAMLRRRRADPASWHVCPFPLQYQVMGGEANQLAPKDLFDQAYDVMLNSSKVPPDMYRGTLQLQVAPVALRLFEAIHLPLVSINNQFLRWFADQASRLLKLSPVSLALQRVTHADNFDLQMMAMQLYMGQQLSGQTAYRGLGFNWKDEQRRVAEEAAYQQQLQAELQDEMSQSALGEQVAKGQAAPGAGPVSPLQAGGAQAGGAPAGGDPSGGAGGAAGMAGGAGQSPVSQFMAGQSPNTPITPQELIEQAQGLAQSLLGLPASQQNSELRALKQRNPLMHAQVSMALKNQRSQARSAGGAMLLGQQPSQPQQ